jgi:hypothetical protein
VNTTTPTTPRSSPPPAPAPAPARAPILLAGALLVLALVAAHANGLGRFLFTTTGRPSRTIRRSGGFGR